MAKHTERESKRARPNQWRPDEDKALAEADPLIRIAEEMQVRGFDSLWTAKKIAPQAANRVAISFDDRGKTLYLRKLATTGRHAYSAACAGVCRSTVNKHKRDDPVFAAAIEEALEYFRDLLGGELVRRGVEGFEEEVLGGKNRDQIFKLKKYSDRCLELLGRIHIPAMNTQRLPSTATQNVVDNSSNTVVNNTFDIEKMSEKELLLFKQLIELQTARLEEEEKLLENNGEKVIEHES